MLVIDATNRQFELCPATDDDYTFAFDTKRDALGPCIIERWGWDDATQLRFHAARWREKPWHVIVVEGERVGTVSIVQLPTHLQFGEFYVRSQDRRRGLGSAVLLRALRIADEAGLETRLEHLKWNPVGSLYARHGFELARESTTHRYLSRPPRRVDAASGVVFPSDV